jgi:apolipoprotein N-acyltransferase
MRAAELGTPVIHAAVTGKSVFVGEGGEFVSDETGLGTIEILRANLAPFARSIYARTGDALMGLAALVGVITWWRVRRPLVGSRDRNHEEE